MPITVFESPDGNRISTDIAIGESVMHAARDNGVAGIEAECSGQLTCATCHVYVDAAWYDKFPAPGEEEAELLEIVDSPMPNSRLSCQLIIGEDMDGVLIHVPQH